MFPENSHHWKKRTTSSRASLDAWHHSNWWSWEEFNYIFLDRDGNILNTKAICKDYRLQPLKEIQLNIHKWWLQGASNLAKHSMQKPKTTCKTSLRGTVRGLQWSNYKYFKLQ